MKKSKYQALVQFTQHIQSHNHPAAVPWRSLIANVHVTFPSAMQAFDAGLLGEGLLHILSSLHARGIITPATAIVPHSAQARERLTFLWALAFAMLLKSLTISSAQPQGFPCPL